MKTIRERMDDTLCTYDVDTSMSKTGYDCLLEELEQNVKDWLRANALREFSYREDIR